MWDCDILNYYLYIQVHVTYSYKLTRYFISATVWKMSWVHEENIIVQFHNVTLKTYIF